MSRLPSRGPQRLEDVRGRPIGSPGQAGFDAPWESGLSGADLDAVLPTRIGDAARPHVELRGTQARIALGGRNGPVDVEHREVVDTGTYPRFAATP